MGIMIIKGVRPKDICVDMELTLTELGYIKFILDHSSIDFDSNVEFQQKAIDFMNRDLCPMLNELIKEDK